MHKIVGIALAGALAFGTSASALAASPNVRLRGTIESVGSSTLTMKTYSGATETLAFGTSTKFTSVVPARIEDVKSGEFVGIGATGPESKITALEVVIFPNSLRGTGEGHYPWSVPAAVAAADRHQSAGTPPGAPPVQGTMTNATVTSAAPATVGPPVQGTMTNGTVASSSSSSGGITVSVSYNNGKHVRIAVPAGTPIVRFEMASHSVLVPGAKAFAVASKASDGTLTAEFVAVGKNGLMPPM